MMQTGNLKFGVITDVHHYDGAVSEYWNMIPFTSDAHWRRYSTAEARLTAAVDQANTSGCRLFIQLGDIVDDNNSLDDATTRLSECVAITDTFAGDGVIYVLGNHCNSEFSARLDTVYWPTVEDGHNHVRRSNPYNTSYGYTYDHGPYRFVAMYSPGVGVDIADAQLDWLYKGDGTGVLETTLNCVVLSHAVFHESGSPNAQWYDTVGNPLEVIERFEAAGSVIVVLQGHFHRNGIEGYDNQLVAEHNGITYLAMRGSILGKTNGTEDGGTTADSAYWVIEFEDTGTTIDMTITGYEKGSSGTSSATKRKYLIA